MTGNSTKRRRRRSKKKYPKFHDHPSVETKRQLLSLPPAVPAAPPHLHKTTLNRKNFDAYQTDGHSQRERERKRVKRKPPLSWILYEPTDSKVKRPVNPTGFLIRSLEMVLTTVIVSSRRFYSPTVKRDFLGSFFLNKNKRGDDEPNSQDNNKIQSTSGSSLKMCCLTSFFVWLREKKRTEADESHQHIFVPKFFFWGRKKN